MGTLTSGSGQGAHRSTIKRRRVVGGVVLSAALVLGLIAVLIHTVLPGAEGPPPSLALGGSAGDVVTTGHDFKPSTLVEVAAQLDGGSGSTQLRTDDAGGFTVVFQPPGGFSGTVRISATTGDRRVDASIDSTQDRPAQTSPADGSEYVDGARGQPRVIPITGAPAETPATSGDAGLPRYGLPATVPADCSVDVTEQINDWLTTVPDGSRIDFATGACYRVDGSVTLDSRQNLVIEGNGATFRATTRVATPDTNRAQWRLDYGSGITLRNMTLVGVNPKAEFSLADQFDHNLFIRGSHGVVVQNVHGRNAFGDFIAIAHGEDGTSIPGDITISNVSSDTTGRMGISCVACDGVSVNNSIFTNIAYHAFDLEIEGDNRPGRNVRFTNNVIEAHGWAFFSVGTPFQTYNNDLSNVYIAGNVMTEPGSATDQCLPALSFLYSKIDAHNVVIEKNTIVSRSDAIMVKRASGVTISDNTANLVGPTCGSPVGIRTIAVGQPDIQGNHVTGYRSAYERD